VNEVALSPIDPTSSAVGELFEALDAMHYALYPPASVHSMAAAALKEAKCVFLGAFAGQRLLGCGGYVNYGGEYGELKRMFVRPEVRGLGIGRRLLAALEGDARNNGLTIMRLETGIHQPEALRLYEVAGYVRRGPFADYPDDPLSVYMEKRLG
jgi:putative acetyltransferase